MKKNIVLIVISFLVFFISKSKCNHTSGLKSFKSYNLKTNYHQLEKYSTKELDTTISWKMLRNVKYVDKPHPEYDIVYHPVYGKSLLELEGKTIIIKGYIIPIDDKTYALSKNVFAACFFCGQAGPETIMGIKFKKKQGKLNTDTYVTLRGRFKLNHNNPEDWMYHILNAEILEINP